MKLYNLCMREDYDEFINKYPDSTDDFRVDEFTSYCETFYYFYVRGFNISNRDVLYRLDGPTYKVKEEKLFLNEEQISFMINGIGVEGEEYWKHPDVIAYMYLKDHPELEGFV